MFQTPQRKSAGGIMAGVAPINAFMGPMGMSNGGDVFSFDDGKLNINIPQDAFAVPEGAFDTPQPDLSPEALRLGLFDTDNFFSTEQKEDGKINMRDITDMLIVDPSDPLDVGIAAATAPLMIFPPTAIAAQLVRMGYKASKAKKMADRAANIQNKIPGILGGGTSRLAGYGQAQVARVLGDIGQGIDEAVDINLIPSAMADMADEEEPEMAQISAVISESEPEEEGGITSLLPKSIKEARKMKSATFTRDGKKKAAVTKEELEASGLGSLREYLNQMKFDEESGRYVQKKAAGGIANFAAGGGAALVKEGVKEGVEQVSKLDLDSIANLAKRFKKALMNADDAEVAKIKKEVDGIEDPKIKEQVNDGLKKIFDEDATRKATPFDLGTGKPPEPPKPRASASAGVADDAAQTGVRSADDAVEAGGTVTNVSKTGFPLGKTILGGAGLGGLYMLLNPDETPKQTQQDSGPAPSPQKVDKPLDELIVKPSGVFDADGNRLAEPPKFGDKIKKFASGAREKLGNIDPSILAGLINMGSSTDLFEPPKTDAQKFLEGQQGYRLNEAQIAQAQAQAKPGVLQTYDAVLDEIEDITGSKPTDLAKRKILSSLFISSESNDKLNSLFKAYADNPELKDSEEGRKQFKELVFEVLEEQGFGETLNTILQADQKP
tara:strand:+ start:871 stop:2868 length:1998 start_codon:yes stop_codon:yes gene_type:complete